jgi:poly(3-hydroxybutyrate) depolymerase
MFTRLLALTSLLVAGTAAAEVTERIHRVAGTAVHYKLVVPEGYDAAREHPGVLVFGGGPQTMRTVEGTLERNFRDEAERRGYIVIAPAAPDDELFFRGGDRIFPEFLDAMIETHKIAGGSR